MTVDRSPWSLKSGSLKAPKDLIYTEIIGIELPCYLWECGFPPPVPQFPTCSLYFTQNCARNVRCVKQWSLVHLRSWKRCSASACPAQGLLCALRHGLLGCITSLIELGTLSGSSVSVCWAGLSCPMAATARSPGWANPCGQLWQPTLTSPPTAHGVCSLLLLQPSHPPAPSLKYPDLSVRKAEASEIGSHSTHLAEMLSVRNSSICSLCFTGKTADKNTTICFFLKVITDELPLTFWVNI